MQTALKGIDEIRWWHRGPLKDGRVTPGLSNVSQLEDVFLFPSLDFTDKSVLDIGCWDGYFSFRADQLGAKRVFAIDDPYLRWGGMDGFELVTHFQQTPQRGATIYRRVTQDVPKYPAFCYSLPPLNAPKR